MTENQPVRFRRTVRQNLQNFALPGGLAVFLAVTNNTPLRFLPLAVVLVAFPVQVFQYVELTRDHAEVCWFPGVQRRVRWADVQLVLPEIYSGSEIVSLYEHNGRQTRLPAPRTAPMGSDPQYRTKTEVIGNHWLAHRGADWREIPGFVAEPVTRPRLWSWPLATFVIVFVVLFVVADAWSWVAYVAAAAAFLAAATYYFRDTRRRFPDMSHSE